MLKSLRNKGAWDKLTDMTESIRVCMFCTTDVHGNMRSRPMITLQVDDEGDLWFFASAIGDVYTELGEEGHCCLCYAHPGRNDYLSVTARTRLVRDKAKNKEFWTAALRPWFPQGIADPDLVLIRVIPESAMYWDNNAGKMVTLFSLVKSAVTGKDPDLGDRGELEL